MIHPTAWLIWLFTVIVALSTTRNPIYLGIILVCLAGVVRAIRATTPAPPLPLSIGRLALLIVFTSAVFNLITAHFGQTILFQVPATIPLLGGPFTLEALVFGAINGLALAGFLGAFSVLTLALPAHALVRLMPRALYPMAVVVSIAVAFVPTTLLQFQQVREAQLVRGHQVRGLRDWLPLFMPLLIGGLERAFQLAEAMTARGLGMVGAQAAEDKGRLRATTHTPLLVLGLVALLAGLLLRLMWGQVAPGLAAIVLGAGLIVAALWLQGRAIKRTSYRTQPWTGHDWAVAAGAAITAVGYVLLPRATSASLGYTPYPKLSLPPFDWPVALATLGLAVPAIVLWRASRENENGPSEYSDGP